MDRDLIHFPELDQVSLQQGSDINLSQLQVSVDNSFAGRVKQFADQVVMRPSYMSGTSSIPTSIGKIKKED